MLTSTFAVFLTILVTSATGLRPSRRGPSLTGSPRDESNGRLSQDLTPYHYNVEIRPNIYNAEPPFPFYGHVTIYFTANVRTNLITLNSKDLIIDGLTIRVTPVPGQIGTSDPVVTGWSLNDAAEFLYVNLENQLLRTREYIFDVDFSGTMRSDGYGLYYDYYTGADNITKYVATTQFEEHGGRMTFPSFDEPDFKATFNTSVVRMPPFVSVANMPIRQTVDRGNGWLADYYETTPKMSLYLFAFAVGDLQKLDAGNINGYQVGIWARPEIIPQMNFVKYAAPQLQAWLDSETGITYKEPKSDHAAFPNKGGAMEHWGMISYGEQYLAINPDTSSAIGKQTVGIYLSHEMAHLWYGDMVTCQWWNDIWLNEGFATYYDYRPTQALGWEGSEASLVDTQYFLEDDQRNSSDPVRKDIPTVWDSGYSFEGSTYPKGGAMVRFLEGILTTTTFKRGLTNHLSNHQYDTSTTDDLWQSLTNQARIDGITNPDGSALDVKARMDPWLNQMGFPLISVTRRTDGTALISRSHFLRPPGQIMETSSPYNYEWAVPITLATADSPASAWDALPSAYIESIETQITVSGFPTDLNRWAVINTKAGFYYRVMYDSVSFNSIVTQLLADNTVIHVDSRSQFIDDAFSVARAGYFSETYGMESTQYLASEANWGPWFSALRHLEYSDRLIRDLSWGGLQRTYILGLTVPIYEQLGWGYTSTETPFEQFMRRDMISVSCTYGHAACLTEARAQYALVTPIPSANVVDPNNLPTVLCVGVNEGTSADWQISFDQYLARKSSQIREERYAYLFGCSCTSDTVLLDRLLVELGTTVASRDRNRLAQYLSQSDYGAQILYSYLDANWNSLPGGIGRMTQLRNIALGFSTQAELDGLYAFKGRHPPASQTETNLYTNLILDVEANVEWVQTEGPALEQWLLAHQPAGLNVEMRNGRPVNLPNSAMKHWAGVHESYRSDLYRI